MRAASDNGCMAYGVWQTSYHLSFFFRSLQQYFDKSIVSFCREIKDLVEVDMGSKYVMVARLAS